jgi:hypothetical protein
MKNLGVAVVTLIAVSFLMDCSNSSSSGGGGNPTDPFAGHITFSDGAPSGSILVRVSTVSINSYADVESAKSNYVASGVVSQGNVVNLLDSGGNFNKNGSYTVLYYGYSGNDLINGKHQNGVRFTNGNVTLAKSSMIDNPTS